MPVLLKYTVRHEIEVVVTATSPTYAAELADRVISKTKKPDDQINVVSWPRTVGVIVREER